MNIETKRLTLRRFKEEDAEALFRMLSLPEVVFFEPYGIMTYDEAKEEALRRRNQPAFIAVCLKGDDQLIGNLYFAPEGPSRLKTYTLGYVFHPAYQKKGYATEACLAILRHGFLELGVHRIVASCDQDNVRSWQLLERLNMRREGSMVKNVYFKYDDKGQPRWVNSYHYAILEEEFEAFMTT
ncbi:MAG: GNAT family N-acetyltransferase [Acholeplasmataceae bacterium]|nr:GNAT family N-acetyltransferase [Acholeplasmataceae bacterium]